jgi:long-chain acyl-CoA synthetase
MLERLVPGIAAGLAAAGARPGDRIALPGPGGGAYVAVAAAALRAGIVPVPLNPGLTAAERGPLLGDADPALVWDGPPLPGGPVRAAPPIAPVGLARPMHYTSGTTGRPKGVWSGLLDETAAAAMWEDERALWRLGPADTFLVAAPLAHSAPLRFALTTLHAGGAVLVLGRFDARRVLDLLAAGAVTATFLAPTALARLLEAAGPGPVPAPGLRLLAHAGAPCPEPLKRRILDAFPDASVEEFYGSTEGQFTHCPPEVWREAPGTVGVARSGRTMRVDDDGTVWCRPPAFGRFEYWRDAAKTAAAWHDGFFTAGDAGRLDERGRLFLSGRRDDLIISGGVNVYPAEVEAALADVAGVRAVAVFGAADERWGERVCAAVVGDASEAALRERAAVRLAAYKRPKTFVFVDSIPTTATGKVLRGRLAADLGVV